MRMSELTSLLEWNLDQPISIDVLRIKSETIEGNHHDILDTRVICHWNDLIRIIYTKGNKERISRVSQLVGRIDWETNFNFPG